MQVILPAAFQLETDGEAQLVELVPGEKFAMVAVADFDEAAPPPLAAVRPLVQQQWALAEGAKGARAAAEKVRKAVDGGQTLQAALAAANVKGAVIESINGTRADLSTRRPTDLATAVADVRNEKRNCKNPSGRAESGAGMSSS